MQTCLYLIRQFKELNATAQTACTEQNASNNLEDVVELMEELSYELRNICSSQRPSVLKDLGLIPALEILIEDTMKKELVTITFEVNDLSWEQRLEEELEVAIYRLIQEGIRISSSIPVQIKRRLNFTVRMET